VITFPETSYFDFDTNTVTFRNPVNTAPSFDPYGPGGPTVTLTKNPATSLFRNVLTISNLSTTFQATNYMLEINGVRNPFSEKKVSGITCKSYVNAINVESTSPTTIIEIVKTDAITTGNRLYAASVPKVNGAMADLTLTLTPTTYAIPPNGGAKLTLPVRNMVYSILNQEGMPKDFMLTTTNGVTITATFVSS
jgi:hypothetical protein